MLALEHVKFSYGPDAPTYDFSLEVKPGEILALMGESGSGKSTLLDLICGFQRPSDGKILWGDTNLVPLPPENRPVTILFQNNNLFEHLTAFKNVALGLEPNRKLSSSQTLTVTEVLSKVGLKGFENRLVSKLSGGQ